MCRVLLLSVCVFLCCVARSASLSVSHHAPSTPASTSTSVLYPEIGPHPLDARGASVLVYSQSQANNERGKLSCDVNGDESFVRTAWLKLTVDDAAILTASASTTRLSDTLAATSLTVRTFQHSTYSCIRVDVPQGLHIPSAGHVKIQGSFGSEEFSGFDMMGFQGTDSFVVEANYDIASYRGPQLVVLATSVQTEEALVRSSFDLEDVVSEPAAKIVMEPQSGNFQDLLESGTVITHSLELLIPSSKFDLWVPPQIKDRSFNSIRLYIPSRINYIDIQFWNVSWAMAGREEFSKPLIATPGTEILADGLHPDTLYQFLCCAVFVSSRDPECDTIQATTTSYTGQDVVKYHSFGTPHTHPLKPNGVAVVIPEYRSRNSPSTAFVALTFSDIYSGKILSKMTFNETGNHVIADFDSSDGYRVAITLVDDSGRTFHFEEASKNSPRSGEAIKQINIGQPQLFRPTPASLIISIPNKLTNASPAKVVRTNVRVLDAVTQQLLQEQSFDSRGVKYINDIPEGSWMVSVVVTDSSNDDTSQTFLFNPVYTSAISEALFGEPSLTIIDSGEVTLTVPPRLVASGPKVVQCTIEIRDAIRWTLLDSREITGADTIKFIDLPTNSSLFVSVAVTYSNRTIESFETLIRRLDSIGTTFLLPATPGTPRPVIFLENSATIAVPAYEKKGVPNDIMRTQLELFDLLDGSTFASNTAPGSGIISARSSKAVSSPFGARLSVFHGTSNAPLRKDQYFFTTAPNGLPPFESSGDVRAWIKCDVVPVTVPSFGFRQIARVSSKTTQHVIVRVPANPAQLPLYDNKPGRVDVEIYGSPIFPNAVNGTDIGSQKLLMRVVDLAVGGDSEIRNLPDPSTTKLDVVVRVWGQDSLLTQPAVMNEVLTDRERRKQLGQGPTFSYAYTPLQNSKISSAQNLLQTSTEQFSFGANDGSFVLVLNGTKTGLGMFKKLELAQQFPFASPKSLPGQLDAGGIIVVPTDGGVIIRTTSRQCASCAQLDSALVLTTLGVPGQEGSCKGAPVGKGEWEMPPRSDLFIPLPTGSSLDVCATVFEQKIRWKISWNIQPSFDQTLPLMEHRGLPRVLPFDSSRMVVRVPKSFVKNVEATGDIGSAEDTADAISMHSRVLLAFTASSSVEFAVDQARLTVTRSDTGSVILTRVVQGGADSIISMPSEALNSRVPLDVRFELHGHIGEGDEVQNSSAVHRTRILNHIPETSEVPAPLNDFGVVSLLCRVPEKSLIMRMPRFSLENNPIVSAEYLVQFADDASPVLWSGNASVGSDLTFTSSKVRSGGSYVVLVNTTDDHFNRHSQYASVTCANSVFPPLPAAGMPHVMSTRDGFVNIRIPSKLYAEQSPIGKIHAELRKCATNELVVAIDSDLGGDFAVPPSLHHSPACYNLTANISLADADASSANAVITLNHIAPIPKLSFLPLLPLHAEVSIVPVGSGSFVFRVPFFPAGFNEKAATRRLLAFVTLEVQEVAEFQTFLKTTLPRGGDTILNIPECSEQDCSFSITHQQIDETGDVAAAVVTKISVVSSILTSIPDPQDPDVWTPTSDSISIQNPLDQLLHYKVAELFTGKVIADQQVMRRGTFVVDRLQPATRYVITTEYSKNGTSFSVPLVLMTPLARAVINETGRAPMPLHATAGSTSLLVQSPDFTDDLRTQSVDVTATDANNTVYHASLSNPTRGEVLLLEGLTPLTNYTVQITTVNTAGTFRTTTKKIRTTRSTNVWGYSHTIANKSPTSFDVFPATPLPPGISGMYCAVEDTTEKIPQLLYSGPPTADHFTVKGLRLGRRFRVGWSMRTENATYYDLCAFVSSDADAGSGLQRKPFVLRVTSDQVYIGLPQVQNLDRYIVKSVEMNENNREVQRIVLYEGLGDSFNAGTDGSGWGPIKMFVARMLSTDTLYTFEVQSHYQDGSTGTPALLEATTDSSFAPCIIGRPLAPAAPVIVPGTNVNRQMVVLWNYMTKNEGSDPNAYPTTSYSLEMRVLGYNRQFENTSAWEFVGRNINFQNNQFTVPHTVPGYEYQFRLTAFNFWGQSDTGAALEAIIPVEAPEAVPGFTISNSTSRSFAATWDVPYHNGDAITSYTVQCQPPPLGSSSTSVYPSDHRPADSSFGLVYSGPNRSTVINNLVPAANYTCHVQAVNSIGASPVAKFLSEATGWTKTDVPEQMVGVSALVNTPRTLMVGFQKPRHNGLPLQSFDVSMRRPGMEGFELVCDDTAQLYCNVTSLLPGETYTFKVRATNCKGQGQASAEVAIRTRSDVPDAGSDITLKEYAATTLHMSWTAGRANGEEISSHSLECDNGATCLTPAGWQRGRFSPPCVLSGTNSLPSGSDPNAESNDPLFREVFKGTAPEVFLQNLLPATTYRCRSRSLNAIGWSLASNISVLRTDDSSPDVPFNLNFTLGQRNFVANTFPILVTWSTPAPNGKQILYFEAEMKNVSRIQSSSGLPVTDRYTGAAPVAFQWTSVATHLTMPVLDVGQLAVDRTFKFRVRAANDLGLSEWGTFDISIPRGRPEQPGGMVLKGKTAHTLDLLCPLLDDGGLQVTSYVVEVSAGPKSIHSDNPDIAPFSTYQVVYQGAAPRVVLDNLDDGTDYKCRCKAINALGFSDFSSPAMFSTLSGPPDQPLVAIADAAHPATATTVSFRYTLPDDNGQRIARCDFEVGGSWSWDHAPFSSAGDPYETKLVVQDGYVFPYAAAFSITVDQLLPARSFSIRLRCWNSFGSSTWSDVVRQNTLGIPPASPAAPSIMGSMLSASALTGEQITRVNVNVNVGSASNNGNAITSVKTLLSCSQGLCALLQPSANCQGGSDALRNCRQPVVFELCVTTCTSSGVECDSCSIQNLLPASVYVVRNKAQNALGWSQEGSVLQLTTPNTVPTSPQSVAVTFSSPTTATVNVGTSIDGGLALTSHVVRVQCTSTTVTACATSTSTTFVLTAGTVTYPRSLSITNLIPALPYSFSVFAVNSVGQSPAAVGSGTTPASAPAAPPRPRLSSLSLSWDVPNLNGGSAATYQIQASPVFQNRFSSNSFTSTTTSKTFTSSQFSSSSDLWQFRVRATNSGGLCSASGSACGYGPWSSLSNAYSMAGLTQCPVDPAFSSSSACSGHGTCDQTTFRCYCEGNYLGNACQYRTTVGICQNAVGIWAPFGLAPFTFTTVGEFLMYQNTLLFGEKIHAVLATFPATGGTAINRVAAAFEGQVLSIELDQSDPTACPRVRHNCNLIDYSYGTYVALAKTDQTGKLLGNFQFDGSCSAPQFTITNGVTGTRLVCNRFLASDGQNHPKFFQSCSLSTARRLCDSTCNSFSTETGLCGREGQSLSDPTIADITLSPIAASSSIFVNAEGTACANQAIAVFTQLSESRIQIEEPELQQDIDPDHSNNNNLIDLTGLLQLNLETPVMHASLPNVQTEKISSQQQQRQMDIQMAQQKAIKNALGENIQDNDSQPTAVHTSSVASHSLHHNAHASFYAHHVNLPETGASNAVTVSEAETTIELAMKPHVTSASSKIIHRSKAVTPNDEKDKQQPVVVDLPAAAMNTDASGNVPASESRASPKIFARGVEGDSPYANAALRRDVVLPVSSVPVAQLTIPISNQDLLQTSAPEAPTPVVATIPTYASNSIIPELTRTNNNNDANDNNNHVTRLDLVRSQQMALQVTSGLKALAKDDAALVSLVGAQVTNESQLSCPSDCSEDSCQVAIAACENLRSCRLSCVTNVCNSRCSFAVCAQGWAQVGERCDEQMALTVSVAQTQLLDQITAAHLFESSIATQPDLGSCPEFVSSSEIWNLAPYDRSIAVWTAAIIKQIS